MIYIFKGFGEICKAPCTLCKGLCDAFKQSCSFCNTFWNPILENPLGNYVIGTWVSMVFVFAASLWGLMQLSDCKNSDDVKTNLMAFCVVNVILAFIHSGMSYYIQRQIIQKVGDKPYSEMNAKEIQEKAGEILMYDVPFCLYSFLAIAGYGMQLWALSLGGCDKEQPHFGSAAIYLVWGTLAGGYLFCWYCCQCCQGSIPKKGGKSGPPAVAVGAASA